MKIMRYCEDCERKSRFEVTNEMMVEIREGTIRPSDDIEAICDTCGGVDYFSLNGKEQKQLARDAGADY